jgi:hypothetical protein
MVPGTVGYDAVLDGYDTSFSGQFGTGLTGRANGSSLSTGRPLDLGTSPWTIMFWADVTRASNQTAAQYVFADQAAGDLRCNLNGGGQGNARLAGAGIPQVLIPGAVDPSMPHHVTYVRDDVLGEIRGYLDGVLVVTQGIGNPNFGPGSDLWLGAHPAYGQRLREGTVIDEFRVYGRALSDAEISDVAFRFVPERGTPAVYETNDARSRLTFAGAEGNRIRPAVVEGSAGVFLDVTLDSVHWGQPYDVLFAPTPLRPVGSGGTVLWDGQIVNVDLASPTTTLLFGAFALPFVPQTFTLAPTASLEFVTQMVVVSPAEPSGVSVSGATELRVGPTVGTPNVVIEAVGNNTYNNNGSQPFWRVTHNGTTLPVTRVLFDVTQSTNGSHGNMRFDLDQDIPGVGTLILGNGAAPCQGSYWNGSDVATGLIYDGSNTYVGFDPGTGCAGGNCGFIAGAPWANATEEYRRLEYRFTPGFFFGNTFELDMDTDGGDGVDGRAMAGLFVSVELMNGTVLSGHLEVDPERENASILRL